MPRVQAEYEYSYPVCRRTLYVVALLVARSLSVSRVASCSSAESPESRLALFSPPLSDVSAGLTLRHFDLLST
eukprot:scaffold216454_cov42-Prasinocladus_malaysianus.AAC.1